MNLSVTRTVLLTAAAFFCCTGTGQAKSVTFMDDDIYFPGYGSTATSYPADAYGTPVITSMTVDWDAGGTNRLEKVTLHLSERGIQNFDSLFINTDYNPDIDDDWSSWNYFVHGGGSTNADKTDGIVPRNGLYAVNNNFEYTLNDEGGREDHPNGIDAGFLGPRLARQDNTPEYHTNSYSRLYSASGLTLTYDFTRLTDGIILGDSFAFAYSPWCANDIIIGTYNGDPVAEPATLLLFGSGILGIAGLRKRQKTTR